MSAHRRRLVVAAEAADDIEDIFVFSCQHWGFDRALQYKQAIEDGISSLLAMPEIGRRVQLNRAAVRVLDVEQHRIVYKLTATTIRILRVPHNRMLLEQLIEVGS